MIREISIKDKESWRKLYKGYADFYKSAINDIILENISIIKLINHYIFFSFLIYIRKLFPVP